ncbi:hypothetical protein CC86DRAFT_405241 [Ophiobolus disseminans]|uniref:Uncharacterized protein n=1 Tax=Ophiobolus disseminans TaxID=1469910 RepID=A0A6A7A675_9PLEO|nr:hypothetical protein CC86DRAFT_405241 [Ophiobolus disseminans]
MGISDSNNVPKLSADGSNFKKWKSAVIIYAQMHGALDVLTGDALEPPKPTKDGLLKQQEPLDVSTLAHDNPEHVRLIINRKAFDDNVKSNNKTIIEEHNYKFRMCLNRLEDLSLGLPTAGVLYQFILAIEDTYPKYARSICRDLRSKRTPTLDAVIKELNDESRREDLVKTAFASNH